MSVGLEKLGPISDANPMVDQPCPACGEVFKIGDLVTLVPLGPGAPPEERRKAREGQDYTSVALQVHWACATGEE